MWSKIDHFQLLILCKDKYCNRNTLAVILKPLVEELKLLKSIGVDLGFRNKKMVGSVMCLLGNNLSSHVLGGFTTSFSNANCMCRFCTVTRQEFLENCLYEKSFRTQQVITEHYSKFMMQMSTWV